MAGTKPTPGPWMAATAISSVVGLPVVAQTGRLICNVNHAHDPVHGKVAGDDAFNREAIANARLIAAAPELLDALRQCQSALAMMVAPDAIKSTSVLHAFAQVTAAEVVARAAIAKASPQSLATEER